MKRLRILGPFIAILVGLLVGVAYYLKTETPHLSANVSLNFSPQAPTTSMQSSAKTGTKKEVPYLTCSVLDDRVADFLANHYLFREFDEELSRRTFQMYLKILDPGKTYFLAKDIQDLEPRAHQLGQQIRAENCSFIFDVYNIFKTRVSETTQETSKILAIPFDFNQDEFIETDRKKIAWATSREELNDRWRKNLKFVLLNMSNTESATKTNDRIKKRYELFTKDVLERPEDDVYAIFLNAFSLSLDPHSSFLTPDDNAQFQIDFSLKLVGIGATLMAIDGYTVVDSLVPGGAADQDGRLRKGDKIIAVDAGDNQGLQDTIDMDLAKVVKLIRGKENSTVRLMILRQNTKQDAVERFEIKLKRRVVEIKESQAQSDVFTVNGKKLGVIQLPSFYVDYKGCSETPLKCRSSAGDMLRETRRLMAQNVDGIVIDLRRNGGGDLSEVQKIVGIYINQPVVTQVEDRNRTVRALEVDSKALYHGPLAVLVSRYTASASEILAGAIQDYGRGLILGDSRTFGKGTVQTVMEIPGTQGRLSDGAIHVTIAKFYRPSGRSNQERGILSDIVIPNVLDAAMIGEEEYEYALPYTTISPSRNFKPLQDLNIMIPALRLESRKRIEASPQFEKILSKMKQEKQEDSNTLASLKKKDTPKIVATATNKGALNNGQDNAQNTPPMDAPKSNPNDDDPSSLNYLRERKVIHEKDVILNEAAHILVDSISL